MIEKPTYKSTNKLYDGLNQARAIQSKKHKSFHNLNSTKIRGLRSINKKLMDIEKVIKKEVIELCTYAQMRVNNPNDIVLDFEIKIELLCCLDKKHPAFQLEASDNLLTILTVTKYNLEWKFGFGDNKNHNTLPNRLDTPKQDVKPQKHQPYLKALIFKKYFLSQI